MADPGSRETDIARTIAGTIAHPSSHSMKHLKEFTDPQFGTPLPITNAEQLQDHAFNILTDPNTRVIWTRDTVTYLMHEPTQTCINLRVQGRLGEDGGTIYKFDRNRYADESDWIAKAVAKEAERMGVSSFPERKGFLPMLQENPELAALFEQRYTERLIAKQQKAQAAAGLTEGTPATRGETALNPVPEKQPQLSRFTSDMVPVTEGTPHKIGGAGASGVGIVMSTVGLHDAIKNGDGVEGTIAGVNLTTSGLQATETVLEATGNALPVVSKVGKFIPGVNIAATVADGAYQISREDTTEHKVERGAVVAATATTGIVLGTATASAAEAGVITAGVTGVLGTGAVGTGVAAATVAAAPVVLTVAAVGAVAYTGEKVLETKRVWDDLDKTIAESGAPQKRANTTADGKPSIMQYKHIAVEMLRVSADMKDENLSAAPKRDPNGRIHIDEIRKMDMRDPKNIAELERALDLNIKKQEEIMKANDSVLPKWLRGSDSVSKFTMAQMEDADLQGAKKELQMYKQDLKDYDAAHPADPATTASDAAKPKIQQTPAPK